MQEELEQRTVTLIIKSGKLTGRTLAAVFSRFLRFSRHKLHEHHVSPKGKQSVKKLVAQQQGVESAELADKDEAKLFDRIARKYGVDYAIKKGISEKGEDRFILFFKAKDRGAIDQAMRSYTKAWDNRSKDQRPSLRKTLQEIMEKLPGVSKAKDREISR